MFEAAAKSEKVSDRIVEQIRDAVLSGRLKPGDRVASEKELMGQFGVSKATMREALRVLEAMGLVEIRKGIQGGVFIAEVDMKTTIHSIMNFLHFKAVSVHDITMLRFMLEPSVAHMAAARLPLGDIRRLEEMVAMGEDHQAEISKDIGFHRHLARLSGNPVLILIIDFVDNLLRDVKYRLNLQAEFYNQVKDCHRRILDCLVRRDALGARREMARDLLMVGDYLADVTGTPRFDPTLMGFDRDGLIGATRFDSDETLEERLVEAGKLDPALLDGGAILMRRVGSGDLYVALPQEQKRKKRARRDRVQKREQTVREALDE